MRSDEGTDGRRLVLVHGVPGSGKSTLAAALAVELGWSLVSKDAVKVTLLDSLGFADREESRRIGAAAGEVCWTVIGESAVPVVLDTWVRMVENALVDPPHLRDQTDDRRVGHLGLERRIKPRAHLLAACGLRGPRGTGDLGRVRVPPRALERDGERRLEDLDPPRTTELLLPQPPRRDRLPEHRLEAGAGGGAERDHATIVHLCYRSSTLKTVGIIEETATFRPQELAPWRFDCQTLAVGRAFAGAGIAVRPCRRRLRPR
jgi:hypothetical protein